MAKVRVVPPPKLEDEVHITLTLEESSGLYDLLDAGVAIGTVDDLHLRELKAALDQIRYKLYPGRHFKAIGTLA